MKLVMISTDRSLFIENSRVFNRFINYSKIFDQLDVIVFTKKGFQKKVLAENVNIYPTNSYSKIKYISDAIKIGSKLKADVVSSQDAFLTGLVAKKISDLLNAKFHIQIHTDIFSKEFFKHSFQNKLHVFIAKILIQNADAVRVVSKRIFESVRKINNVSRIDILPIFVGDFNIENNFNQIKKNNGFNILMISRFEKEKNVELAIDTFISLFKLRNDINMTILGSGSLENNLKNKVREFNLENNIEFVKTENVFEYLKNADVYIQTSKYEGYGMALIEAALVGLPIVTTDVGIVGEVLIDGGSCLTAKSDASDFAVKINHLLDDESLRQNLGGRAKESALNHVKNKDQYLFDFQKAFTI